MIAISGIRPGDALSIYDVYAAMLFSIGLDMLQCAHDRLDRYHADRGRELQALVHEIVLDEEFWDRFYISGRGVK